MGPRTFMAALESKRVAHPLASAQVDSQLLLVPRVLPDSIAKREIRGKLDGIREEHIAFVKACVKDGLEAAKARTTMLRRFGKALRLGHDLAGVADVEPTDEELVSLASLVETELDYLGGFVKAHEAMDPDRRARQYGAGASAAFYRGWLAMLPPNARIWWELSVAEHCQDCLDFADGSPYRKPGLTPNPLPTLPGNGDSRCLGNCKCKLVADSPVMGTSTLAPRIGVEVTAIGGLAIDPASPGGRAAGELFQGLAGLLAYYQRRHYLEGGRDLRERVREAEAEIGRYARRLGYNVRLATTLGEVLDPVQDAQAHQLRYVPPDQVDDDLLELIVYVLAGDKVTRGKVKAVSTRPPAVTLEDGSEHRLDDSGMGLLFVDGRPAS